MAVNSSIDSVITLALLALALSAGKTPPGISKKIKDGDKEAFRQFFEAHAKELNHYLLRSGLNEEEAQDLSQQAFIYIWEHRDRIKPEVSLRAYLFKIGYTRMLNFKRDTQLLDGFDESEHHSTSQETDQSALNSDLKKELHRLIRSMPEKRRAVFELCSIKEFSYKEAADILDISVKTVENHMAAALHQMREGLKKFRG